MTVRRLAAPLLLVLAWEAAPHLGLADPALLPPVSRVLAQTWHLTASGHLPGHLLASAWRVLLGTGLAAAVALPAGIAMGLHPRLEEAGAALVGALRPLSPPAWIPLAILWFGLGDAPAVFIIFIGTALALLVGTLAATREVDQTLIRAALTLGASRGQVVRHVVLPSLVPHLLAQARLGLSLGWMCVIAAEMVAVRRGVGFMIMEARHLFRTADVLAGMLAIALVGLATDHLLRAAERRLCRWRHALEPGRHLDALPSSPGPPS